MNIKQLKYGDFPYQVYKKSYKIIKILEKKKMNCYLRHELRQPGTIHQAPLPLRRLPLERLPLPQHLLLLQRQGGGVGAGVGGLQARAVVH